MAENEYWKNVLTVVPIVFAGLSTISYALRLFCRRLTHSDIKVEDYLMGVSLSAILWSNCSDRLQCASPPFLLLLFFRSDSPLSFFTRLVAKMTNLCMTAAFNGVGVPSALLPADEQRRLNFVRIA